MTCIHELLDWPKLHLDLDRVVDQLADIRHRQGCLIGWMEALGFDFQAEAVLHILIVDITKTSEIEGENLDRSRVRLSFARQLGMDFVERNSFTSRPPSRTGSRQR